MVDHLVHWLPDKIAKLNLGNKQFVVVRFTCDCEDQDCHRETFEAAELEYF